MKGILWEVALTQPNLLKKIPFFLYLCIQQKQMATLPSILWSGKLRTFWKRTTKICPETKKSKNEYHKNYLLTF